MPRNLLRRFDQFRRRHTEGLNAWFYSVIGRDRFLLRERMKPDAVKRILIIRNNKRIGNMYFLLPFLNAVRQVYPRAQIDLMVIAPSQARVFEGMPITRIWISHFSFDSPIRFLKAMLACRKEPYDLLLMPHPSSTDIIIGGFIHAKNKVSFADPKTSKVYPHSLTTKNPSPHAALTPLALVEPAARDDLIINHRMTITPEEAQKAQNSVGQLKAGASVCIAYFRGARGNKIVADKDWHAIREKFDAAAAGAIAWIEILSPDVTAPLTPQTQTWQSADFRELGAFLSACDLFICGDTGPLHLADAAGARCVGLFTATSPEHYGCLGKTSWNITDPSKLDAANILSHLNPGTARTSTS